MKYSVGPKISAFFPQVIHGSFTMLQAWGIYAGIFERCQAKSLETPRVFQHFRRSLSDTRLMTGSSSTGTIWKHRFARHVESVCKGKGAVGRVQGSSTLLL